MSVLSRVGYVFFRFSHAGAAEQRPKNEITWQAALKDTASRMLLHQPCFGLS
jgi:hypothetical protein